MLRPGDLAPDFKLSSVTGKDFHLAQALSTGSALLAFYKFNCPTCQFTFPFLERIFRGISPLTKVSFVGVAQDAEPETIKFAKDHGLSFDLLCDEKPYPVSRSYGLVTVPTIYLIDEKGIVSETIESFDKVALVRVSEKLAHLEQKALFPVFSPNEQVPLLKPG